MVVARVDEQSDPERESPAVACSTRNQAKRDVTGIGAGFEPDALLDPRLAAGEGPDRHATVKPERFDREMALRAHAAVAPTIGEERVFALAVDHARIGLGEHQEASQRWIDGRDEQAVVTPGERARNGAGGVTSDAVGEPPFAALGLLKVSADFATEPYDFGHWVIHRASSWVTTTPGV